MEQYAKVKFNKGTIIFKAGEMSKEYFYIILSGKVLARNHFCENYTNTYKEGDIIGLISSITYESYYSTVEVLEDVELLQIKIANINKIDNYNLINKISNYLSFILENWLSRYYAKITKNKVDLYNKEDILTMANIYKDNNFKDATYKICSTCIKSFKDDTNIDKAKKLIIHIRPVEKPEKISDNVYRIKKGYCLYSEIDPNDYIYIIKSGKIGIYSIVNSKQTVRLIYPAGYVINCYQPVLEYKSLLTTAIILEDSVIEIINKKTLINIINTDPKFRVNYIKITATKINNATLKIKAINTDKLDIKLIILLYSILKIETLFNKSKVVKLSYTIDDLKNTLNLDIKNDKIILTLNKIKYVEVDASNNIKITNFQSYFDEYKKYII